MITPFLPRLGGKSRLLKEILSFMDRDFDNYIEPFFGGGWVYYNYSRAKNYFLNDADMSVINTLWFLREGSFEKFKLNDLVGSEATFKKLKARFKAGRSADVYSDGDWLYIQKYLQYYGVLGDGETFNTSTPKKASVPLDNLEACHLKLKRDKPHISNNLFLMYLNLVKPFLKGSKLYFLDPPYLGNKNKDRYNNLEINKDEFLDVVKKLDDSVLITLDDKSISKDELEMLADYGYQHKEFKFDPASGNLHKKRLKSKPKKEYIIYKNLECNQGSLV